MIILFYENLDKINSFKNSLAQNFTDKLFLVASGENSKIKEKNYQESLNNSFYSNSQISNIMNRNVIDNVVDNNTNNFFSSSNSENAVKNYQFNDNLTTDDKLELNQMDSLRKFSQAKSLQNESSNLNIDLSGMTNSFTKDWDSKKIMNEITKKLEEALFSGAEGVY